MNPATELHWTQLSKMRTTPQDYLYNMTHEFKPTDAMLFGTCVDAIVFETYGTRLAIFEGKTRSGKAYQEFAAEYEDMEIVTRSMWNRAEIAAEAVLANDEAKKVLEGDRQRFVSWDIGNRSCAGTPDVCGGQYLTDLKVTDPDPRKFHWHGMRMGWHCQLAWYLDGLVAANLPAPESVHIVAVRPKPPHVVTVFDLDDSMIDLGRKEYRLALERLQICEENDYWPGYVEGIAVWSAPEESND